VIRAFIGPNILGSANSLILRFGCEILQFSLSRWSVFDLRTRISLSRATPVKICGKTNHKLFFGFLQFHILVCGLFVYLNRGRSCGGRLKLGGLPSSKSNIFILAAHIVQTMPMKCAMCPRMQDCCCPLQNGAHG